MQAEKWQKVKSIFLDALELEDTARDAFLREKCDDAEIEIEVEKLLDAHFASEDFIEKPAAEIASIFKSNESAQTPKQLGSYKIIREIGAGGMGAVFLAERADGEFAQQAAIKIVRQAIAEKELINRFRRERQILASLNHPHIAKLLDGGVSDTGEPFLVMEYVDGKPLLEFAQDLSAEERLKLFLKICSAVSYAHQNLIIHRDIKPSNILVTKSGEPKLLDFGLAKILDFETDAAQTATAFRALTPAYASPEQLRGENITTASDIYSLGVVLFELLTGKRPFDLKTNKFEEIVRHVSTESPARPSAALNPKLKLENSKVEEENPKSKIQNPKSFRGDIDNIVLTALRKEPERRYKSVEAFAEDIERHLEGLPVSARPNTFFYRAEKFVKRNKIAAGAASLVFLAIVGGLIASLWQAGVARRERDAANLEKLKSEQISQFLSAALAFSDPSAAGSGAQNRRDATINQMLDEFAPRIESELVAQPEVRASLQRTVGISYLSQLRLEEAARYLRAALETQTQIYGEEHQEVAVTLTSLAALQNSKGDYAAAQNTLEKAIAIYRLRPPADRFHTKAFAAALITLGYVQWTRGDYQALDAAYSEALLLASQLQGKDRETLAEAKLGLGTARYALGRLDEATVLLREAVAEYRNMPHARWKLPDALNFLAQVLIWKTEYDEALTLLRESEAISLEVWGENNGYYPRSLYLQVFALCFKGECLAAEKPLAKTEELYKRYFPDNKVAEANNCDARNIVLTRTGRAAEGEKYGRRAIELYQTSMNRGAASITLARTHLAESQMAQKKYIDAERILLEAYKDASEVQGADHWRTKDVARRLAVLYEILGKSELAQKYK